jgi:hypothetical protein
VRSIVSIIDAGTPISSNEIRFTQDNDRGRLTVNMLIANGRWRVFRSVRESGEKLVDNGLFAGDSNDTPWLQKCSSF